MTAPAAVGTLASHAPAPPAARSGGVYHVLNRGNGRSGLFHKPADFGAFLRVLAEGLKRHPLDLFACCLMTNHWHLLLRPPALSARIFATAG